MEREAEIVERVRAGDREAFRALVESHQRLVSHVVLRLVRDAGDREELCQDVFLRVWNKIGSFRGDAKLSTWIARIAYRTSLNHLEKKRLPLYEDLGPEEEGGESRLDRVPDPGVPVAQGVADEEMRAFVRASVLELPMPYRAAVTLHYLEEMSVGEVAEVMDVPAGTVKSHLFRARKLLKDRLLARYSQGELTA
jgi:RNA polymerase sigma-70 factor (ECF subfamily)